MRPLIKLRAFCLSCLVTVFNLFVVLSGHAQDGTGTISGFVQDEHRQPLGSATVNLLHPGDSSVIGTTVTDSNGRFLFEKVKSGDYRVSVTAAGHVKNRTLPFAVSGGNLSVTLETIVLLSQAMEMQAVSVVASKPFMEQKADRMVINVDASPSNAGASVMDVLEKSPGVTVDKDGNISLKGKQGVIVMIDDRPTYMSATQLSDYLKGLPASAIDQLEIMTNPSAKYDAAGNSGIINLKTKKNKAKGFNGNLMLTNSQGVYPKPGASLNLNYRNGKFNIFFNGGYNLWKGFQTLDLTRKYLDANQQVTSIFSQTTHMTFSNPSANAKFGIDYYLNRKTAIGVVLSGFQNDQHFNSTSNIQLKDAGNKIDSIVYSPSTIRGKWQSGSVNLNFRRRFDSTGRELTADMDYVRYASGSDQYFNNTTYTPEYKELSRSILSGHLPSEIDIYSFKSDYTHPFTKDFKLEAGLKTSYVATDNTADYFNIVDNTPLVDTTKTNHFLYRENVNALYLNLNRQYKKWSLQAGVRLENTNYSGHQLGNGETVNNNDSSFSRSYVNLFPTVHIGYQANQKNQFSIGYGRRIDRPDYQDLNPFLFFLDQYTYQAGNPYLQPQFTQNIEFSHTYNNFLSTTLNYSYTENFFTETFEQEGQATIVRKGNIGSRQNAGIALNAQLHPLKWWTAILYTDLNYNKFSGMLYGEEIHISATTLLLNVNNQFKFNKGWGAELSGFYRSRGVEGQVIVDPMGELSAALSKQVWKEKGTLKLGIRDILYTQQVQGYINFQQTEASFHNTRDTRQVSLSFTWRFGKPLKDNPVSRNHGAGEEQNRVKAGGGN